MTAFYAGRDLAAWADVSRVFWRPVGIVALLGLTPPPIQLLSAVSIVWKAALVLSAVGLATRASTALAAVLGTYLIGLSESFGKIHHADAILVWAMAIFAFSRCGDGFSVDSLIRAARRSDGAPRAPHGEYTWPIRMTWLVMSVIFFASGVSKLRHSGLRWVTSDALGTFFIHANYGLGASTGPALAGEWGLRLARMPLVCRSMAAVSLLFELAMPLALFSRRARRILVPGVLALQIGISLFVGPNFLRFGFCYLFWVPWARLGNRIKEALPTARMHHFFYDGSCGLCQKTVAVLRRLDLMDRVEFHDALRDWPSIHAAFPMLRQEDCLETMHVVTAGGEVRTGFDAYRAISWSIPRLWPVAPLLYVPGVPFAGRRVYARVARNRHRAGCPVPAPSTSQRA
jgi:predicted DCC family thiol-disulfide oxidoreductase YuxK